MYNLQSILDQREQAEQKAQVLSADQYRDFINHALSNNQELKDALTAKAIVNQIMENIDFNLANQPVFHSGLGHRDLADNQNLWRIHFYFSLAKDFKPASLPLGDWVNQADALPDVVSYFVKSYEDAFDAIDGAAFHGLQVLTAQQNGVVGLDLAVDFESPLLDSYLAKRGWR